MRRNGLPKYVSEFKDAGGKWRVRARRTGASTLYFKSPTGTDAFGAEYRSWLAEAEPAVVAERNARGTVSALIAEYYSSSNFLTLAASTRRTHSATLERFRLEHGHRLVADMDPLAIDRILDRMAATPAMASNMRKRLNTLLRFAVKRKYRADNPIAHVERIRYKTSGFRTWTEADIAAFRNRWPEGTMQRLALELLLYTGLRRGDVVRLGPKHRDGDSLTITLEKSGHTTELTIPISTELLKHLPSNEHSTYLAVAGGRQRSEKSFTGYIGEAAKAAGITEQASPHGLRKAACRRLAEEGCSALQIQSITGHQNLKELETYVAAASKTILARGAVDAMNASDAKRNRASNLANSQMELAN